MENLTMKEIREQEFTEYIREIDELGTMPTANIIVAGVTGAGKSTLLNAVLGEEFAETGMGEPITAEIKEYKKDGVPVCIWDTCGFELNPERNKNTIEDIKDKIASKNSNQDKFDKIHAIWYCINAEGKKFQETEVSFISELYHIGVPFIIIMTQCFSKKANAEFEGKIREILHKYGLSDFPIVQVLAKEKEIEFGEEVKIISPKGLKELVDRTVKAMPDYLKKSFIAAQKIDKVMKHDASIKIITKYAEAFKKSIIAHTPFARVFMTNRGIEKMFKEIAIQYNTTILKEKDIKDICHETTNDMVRGVMKDLWKSKKSAESEMRHIFKELDINKDAEDYNTAVKSALVLILDGFRFMSALEELWDESTDEELKNIEHVVGKLQEKLKNNYRSSRNKT